MLVVVDIACAATWLKRVLRVLGAIVCALFATQGVWLLIHPTFSDFWEFNHWLGQSMMGILVGLFGIACEITGSLSSVTKHFAKFAMNRIMLCVFYFWLGCFVMGGVGGIAVSASRDYEKTWQALSHATGIIAWMVACGNLIISCAFERHGEEEQKDVQTSISTQSQLQVIGAPAMGTPRAKDNPFDLEAGSDSDVVVEDNRGSNAPAGGWNSAAGKPFGTC